VSDDKAGSVNRNGYVLRSREATETHMLLVWGRKDRPELVRSRKVDGIIQPRVRTNATLKAACATIDLAQQLHLEPPLVVLNGFTGGERAGQLSDPDQAHSSY
jgi:hypothetical protein